MNTDHDKRPVPVDHLALGERRAVTVDDPEESGQARLGANLAAHVHVLVANQRLRRVARDLRRVYNTQRRPSTAQFLDVVGTKR